MNHLIFVVEDDADIRSSIAEVLHDEGYEIDQFEDGDRALYSIVNGKRPSLVLIDLLMPVMSGDSFMKELSTRPEVGAIPVVLITGAVAHPSGVEVLRKPFELDDLLRVVERYCLKGRGGPSLSSRGIAAPSEAG